MSCYHLDDYVVADFSEIVPGSKPLRASVEALQPPRALVQARDLRNVTARAWIHVSRLKPAPALDEALIEFVISGQGMVVANLDDSGSSPLFLPEVKRLSDRRTNKFRAPLRIALEALFLLEGCPAHNGIREGGYGGDPAEVTAVRKSAKRLRATIASFYRADEENRRAERERERASDGMTASERAMTDSEDDFLSTRPSERFLRERKREAIRRANR